MVLHALSGFPARDIKVIGVTGTNGKTTTSFMIHRMLVEAGYNAGLMSTVAYGINNEIQPQIHHMTNVPVRELIQRLKYMKSKGIDWLVLETTSHALAQNRVWGINYSIAVMTNVTHEHLDYHGTFKRYRDAKRKLFKLAHKNVHGKQIGIINADDPSAPLFMADIKTPITYGIEKGDLQAKNIRLTPGGSRYKAVYANRELRIECHIPGQFNVYNSLAAAAVGGAIGLTKEEIERGISSLTRVEGRMDPVDEGQDFDVIVDFAHTPDSFEKLFKDLKPVVRGKLIVLFGSAGRRDEAKRAIQGKLAGEYADEVIITEEDDRDIDGNMIMDMIAEGAEEGGKVRDKNLFLILDRTEAINFAVARAQRGDTLLLLGKGHEKTIERADGEHPWDEIATVREALKNRMQD
jgi:UDP-N-acetylmuramoyl-L-alanyl-D-glutamate--2,6-diaminopimelate ligase